MTRIYLLALSLSFLISVSKSQYTPDWASLDSRPLPPWYDDAKIGIFLHWGVFSVPSFVSEWFWNYWQIQNHTDVIDFMKNNFKPGFTYQDFASSFTAEFFDPDQWAEIFNASGARYVVLTSKHHEGYTLWPSDVSWSWNAKDVGPKRDLVGDLANSVRKYPSLHFGLYHSLYEWFNPIYVSDRSSGFKKQDFVRMKTMPELYELVNRYKPEVIWSDGEGEAHSDYWTSRNFLTWLYNESPVKDVVVTNDRWGNETSCKHGGYYTCQDRYSPGKLQNHKWENAMTVDTSTWGFRRDNSLKDIMKIEDLIALLVETVSCGGNLLVNIGPTHDGRVVPIFEERLRQMGSWLAVNGEAIYGTNPWLHQNDTLTKGVWYTSKGKDVYAILLNWPKGNTVSLGALDLSPTATLSLLGVQGNLPWKVGSQGQVKIRVPALTPDIVPCQWAWTVKIQGDVQGIRRNQALENVA